MFGQTMFHRTKKYDENRVVFLRGKINYRNNQNYGKKIAATNGGEIYRRTGTVEFARLKHEIN